MPKTYQNYFAIGSMTNPVSFSARGLTAIKRQPAELLDHRIVFRGHSGMASVENASGESLHGVLWLCDETNMQKLDHIESTYDRVVAKAKLYDGTTIVDCTIYKFNETRLKAYTCSKKEPSEANGDPSERYLQILIQGCIHHQVKPSYIDWLQEHSMNPRRPKAQWKSFGEAPVGVTMTEEELATHNGKDGARFCYGFNGKVCEVPKGCPVHPMHGIAGGNPDVSFECAKILYDPKYGDPATPSDMSDEHKRCIEDEIIFQMGEDICALTQVIATLF